MGLWRRGLADIIVAHSSFGEFCDFVIPLSCAANPTHRQWRPRT
jgi:hypothetical protein